jgi:hypothetical protein
MWNIYLGNGPGKRRRELETSGGSGEDAPEWVKTKLGFAADAMQREVLRDGQQRGLLNCTWQWGKSTVTAAKAVHQAYHAAESLTLVVSPSSRQSGEFLRKAAGFLRKLKIKPKGDGDNEISLQLPNGSRIVGLPGMEGTVRGFSAVSLLLIDEAARVEDAMYKGLRPMLAVGGGDLWLMSTPRGKRGFFYECWEHGGAEWFRVRVPATECARIPRAFLEAERRAVGPLWFAQEYMGEFVDSGAAVFGRDLVDRAVDDGFEALDV